MKTGNTGLQGVAEATGYLPQWSPVMKTGNTRPAASASADPACLNGARS